MEAKEGTGVMEGGVNADLGGEQGCRSCVTMNGAERIEQHFDPLRAQRR